jgi:hypothetical protein
VAMCAPKALRWGLENRVFKQTNKQFSLALDEFVQFSKYN